MLAFNHLPVKIVWLHPLRVISFALIFLNECTPFLWYWAPQSRKPIIYLICCFILNLSGFPLQMVLFVVAQSGSYELITICRIPYIYMTWNLEHSSAIFQIHEARGKWSTCEYGLCHVFLDAFIVCRKNKIKISKYWFNLWTDFSPITSVSFAWIQRHFWTLLIASCQ